MHKHSSVSSHVPGAGQFWHLPQVEEKARENVIGVLVICGSNEAKTLDQTRSSPSIEMPGRPRDMQQ